MTGHMIQEITESATITTQKENKRTRGELKPPYSRERYLFMARKLTLNFQWSQEFGYAPPHSFPTRS